MPSDVFQWKNSAHKTASLGAGSKFSITNKDYAEDIVRTHDQLERLLEDDVRENCLEDLVCMYATHFDTQISIEHRDQMRQWADDLYDRALNTLRQDYIDNEQEIVQAERDRLADQLAELRPELNCIAGSTRNCFSAHVIAHTMHHNAVYMASLLAKLRSDAITAETEALYNAWDRKYTAYVTADHLDFQKYLGAMQLLVGTWHKTDFTDNTDRDINETVTDLAFTVQYNRTAGSIADTSGVYDGDIASIISDGAGALFIPEAPAG